MAAQHDTIERDAPDNLWRVPEHVPISDEWLERERLDAEQRAWLDERQAEVETAACLI